MRGRAGFYFVFGAFLMGWFDSDTGRPAASSYLLHAPCIRVNGSSLGRTLLFQVAKTENALHTK